MKTPILEAFNSFHTKIRWCTPSLHPDTPQAKDIYANDMSVSHHSLGSPLSDNGIFGEATKLAARAYGADGTIFSVQGTTTSNFMILRALKDQLGSVKMLGTRNAHMSIITASRDYDIDLIPIEPQYDQKLQIFIPNTVDQIMAGTREHKPNVLFLSNPTYEGNTHDLSKIVRAVRKYAPNIIIFVDEGWGSHFSFSSLLPVSAMQAGADVCSQSTHKQGNSLQQNSMIHWKNKRINKDAMLRSYRSLSTTSPSFHMLAALDATRAFMQENGERVIADLVVLSGRLVSDFSTIKGLSVHVASDPTKITLHFPNHQASLVAQELEDDGIIVEKYESNSITLVVGFQNTEEHIAATAMSLRNALKTLPQTSMEFPHFPTRIQRAKPKDAMQRSVSFDEAVGRVCDEDIIPYPPGIPLVSRFELITQEHVDYIKAAHDNGLMTMFMSNQDSLRVCA